VRRKLAVLLAAAMMLAVTASPAVAAPGNNGQGAAKANPNASHGMTTAIAHSGGGCDVACE
jgi:hypothetical protein